MKKESKFFYWAVTACALLAGFSVESYAESGTHTLTVYAGPQSVSPLETIYITVELTSNDGSNIENGTVELSFSLDGKIETHQASTIHGLVSFEVPAQKSSGLMEFSAQYNSSKSNEALVAVVAGPPEKLLLKAVPSAESGYIDITSGIVKDVFGNAVSDLSLVSLNWLDNSGLIGSESLQLSNSHIDHNLACPVEISGHLKLQASLNNLEFILSDISEICRGSKV